MSTPDRPVENPAPTSPTIVKPTTPAEPTTPTAKPPLNVVKDNPVVIEVTPFDLTRDRQIAISKRMGEIVAENGGLVSNIPATKGGEYWQLKAELDALRAAP